MSEYCEYMWDTTRHHVNSALARSIYDEENRFDKRDKKLAIKTVRAILREMPDVDLKHCTDEYITRFLLARKYRTEQAAALIAAYQAQIAHRQDIFGNLTARDPALQRALRAGIPGVLPARDRKGRCVLVILASQWDPIAVPALSVQRAIFLVLEILIQDPRNQQSGFVAVVDWSGFSLRQGGALGAAALRNLIAALRGRFPARFKAIHFLSPPLYVQATLALVKPFLDEKTRNKIYLHGNNLSTLHEHLPTDILPAELGGTGPAFNPGLWAEPVIHAAMKEAELAAIKKEKERTDRAENAEPSLNEQNTMETSRMNGRKDSVNGQTKNPSWRSGTDNHKKSLNPFVKSKNRSEGEEANVEMNLINRTDNNVAKEHLDKNKENASTERLLDKEASQNRSDGEVTGNATNHLNENTEQSKEAEDLTFESHSDTNSNEFEMISNRSESDESKESFLENKLEKVHVRSDKCDTPTEEASLIT